MDLRPTEVTHKQTAFIVSYEKKTSYPLWYKVKWLLISWMHKIYIYIYASWFIKKGRNKDLLVVISRQEDTEKCAKPQSV